jgi:exonuclease SbcD
VDFSDHKPTVSALTVPCFQALESICGDWNTISERLQRLIQEDSQTWLEIIYEGNEIISDLSDRLDEAIAGSKLEILRTRNNRVIERALSPANQDETLDDLDVTEVFRRCLEDHQVSPEQQVQLLQSYQEVLDLLEAGKEQV